MSVLRDLGYDIRSVSCAGWSSESEMHADLANAFQFPSYYGRNHNALSDCLTDLDVPDDGGLAVVLDDFDHHRGGSDLTLDVLAKASRYWLLFGRRLVVLVRTDDGSYAGPSDLGAMPANWNRREWIASDRD